MSFALFHCICFLCSLPLFINGAQNSKNITLGSTLTAGDASNSSWLSPSGDFAFGFQQVSGGFLAAIWFDKIPEKTVTWSANRDGLAQQGSKLQLTVNGFVLSDPNGKQIWSALSGSTSGVVYGAMLDTGNLILSDGYSDEFWQSFNVPTDTILPTQIMSQGTSLIARLSDTNYSSGRSTFIMQNDGNFVSYSLNWPQKSIVYSPYWMSGTAPAERALQVVFNQSGNIYIAEKDGTVVASVINSQIDSAQDHYQRAILEFDGVFRRYVYPRSSAKNRPMNWTMSTDSVPQDICKRLTQIARVQGGGPCGFNSYCTMGSNDKLKCGCPPGYSLFDEMDLLKGCKRDFNAQSCLEEAQGNDRFVLKEMFPAVDFVGGDYYIFKGASEIDCRNSCLSDCLCAAAVLAGSECRKKGFPLSNGRAGTNVTTRAFIKVGIDNSVQISMPNQPANQTIQEPDSKFLIKIFVGSSTFLNIVLLTLAVTTTVILCNRKREEKPRERRDIAGTNMRSFSYIELQEATGEFKEVIGQGAFATVYKGVLDSEEGKFIAVKKLNESVKENQREFESEVKAIALTGHRNLVKLIGFCNDGQHRLLVYDYMPNGSLADILFKEMKPSWFRRIRFAFETARGLNYLHEECNIQIIHCDIKPQNVLLDDSFTARISDFGLAKLLKKDQTHTLTGVRGTKGYVAPEWFRSMPITAKVDVYSFGILLLEIICCRRCFVADMVDETQMVLADWAYDCYKEGRIDKLVEADNEALTDIEKVKKLVRVALRCTKEDPSHRPSMNKVVELIKGALEESPPRDLASHIVSMNDFSGSSPPFSDRDFINI